MTPWEQHEMTSLSRIQTIVTENVAESTLKQQLHENKHITALYLAQLSYFKFDTIRSKMNEFGERKLSLYDHDGTQGFFAELEDMAVVSFRGTQLSQKEDILNALTFWKRSFGKMKVHKGFIQSLENLVPNVIADLEQVPEGKRIVFVGHSMGGALSTLLSVIYKPDELCTFGAPRVAGKELAEHLNDIEYNRIVTKHDWIRRLPPNIPYLLSYVHSGTEHVLPSKWSWRDIARPHFLVTYLDSLLNSENN